MPQSQTAVMRKKKYKSRARFLFVVSGPLLYAHPTSRPTWPFSHVHHVAAIWSRLVPSGTGNAMARMLYPKHIYWGNRWAEVVLCSLRIRASPSAARWLRDSLFALPRDTNCLRVTSRRSLGKRQGARAESKRIRLSLNDACRDRQSGRSVFARQEY